MWPSLSVYILGWTKRDRYRKVAKIYEETKGSWDILTRSVCTEFSRPPLPISGGKNVPFLLVQRGHPSYMNFYLLLSERKGEVGAPFLYLLFFSAFILFYFKIYLCYLAVSGLSCGTQDLRWGMRDLSLRCAGFSLVVARRLQSARAH